MDDDFILWYLTISTPVPQTNLVSIGKDLLLVQKQLPDPVSIYISISWRKHPWKSQYFTLLFGSKVIQCHSHFDQIAKHRQTSEGFAQGAEHGENYRNRLLEIAQRWGQTQTLRKKGVTIIQKFSELSEATCRWNSKYTRQMVEKDMLSRNKRMCFNVTWLFLTKQTCFDIKLFEIGVDVNKLFSSFVCQGSKPYRPYLFLATWSTLRSAYGIHIFHPSSTCFFCRVFFTWTPQILRHFLIFSWGLLFLETAEFLLLGLDQDQMVEVLLLKNLVEKLFKKNLVVNQHIINDEHCEGEAFVSKEGRGWLLSAFVLIWIYLRQERKTSNSSVDEMMAYLEDHPRTWFGG